MKCVKYLFALMLGLIVASPAVAAKGSSEDSAASLKAGTYALVNDGDDNGIYVFKFSLKKGHAYSIYITNPSESIDNLDVYTNNDDAFVGFDCDSNDTYMFGRVAMDDWDEEDPSSVVFFCEVTGEVGATFSLSVSSTYMSFIPQGSADNPASLSFTESGSTKSYTFVNDEYYFRSSLTAGRFYRLTTTSGTETAPLQFSFASSDSDSDSESEEEEEEDEDDSVVTYDYSDSANVDIVFSPVQSGYQYYSITSVASTDTNETSTAVTAFTMKAQLIKARKIADHASTSLNAGNAYTSSFVPGRLIASWDYADAIIDEGLHSISLAKGEKWVFETSGADRPLLMRLYNSSGTVLAENETLDGTSADCRTVIEVATAGTYYIGVCDALLDPGDEVTGDAVTLTAMRVEAIDGDPDEWDASDDSASGANGLEILPGTAASYPIDEGSTHGPHKLSATDWYDTFAIAARKGITYRVGFDFADANETSSQKLQVKIFTLSGTSERSVAEGAILPGSSSFFSVSATANTTYYIRATAAGGVGMDYPAYNVRAVAYSTSGADLGVLTVNGYGATGATWSLGSESVKYPVGASVLVAGSQTVKFSAVKGYATPKSQTVTVTPGVEPTVVDVYYTDTFDTKDDTFKGATTWTLKNTETENGRTLWEDDPEDNFAITGADGCYYDFALRNVEGDDVSFSITNAENGVILEDVTEASLVELPKTKSKYYLVVKNGDAATAYGGYTLAGKFANVGAIKFARTDIAAKENAASVAIAVNRTAKDGVVRVKYGTVAGTAKPGEDYIPQNGILEWESNDNKAKTITIKLIPDLVPVYEGNKTFSVRLEQIEEEELASGEYPAQIAGGDTCVVTLTETARATDTVESAYAKVAPKLATVHTETVGLETGTFYGVLSEEGSLTNGFPQLVSVTLTASTAAQAKLSAKVMLAGSTYTFTGTGWDEGDEEGTLKKEMYLSKSLKRLDEETNKLVTDVVTNVLTVTVASGETATEGDWLSGGGSVTLEMFVPDADNKGYQEARYAGDIYRNNAKIQDYLNVVTNFTGYYTVALAPESVDPTASPAGNGYVTLTVDNKGTVKVAGILSDGSTKPSLSVAACALKSDESSANGYSMYIPVFFAKKPAVFGGEIRLFEDENGNIVADSSKALVWNNDDAKLTYYNEEGWKVLLDPCGGWYDTVFNLQRYYLTRDFYVRTDDIASFPEELLASGYSFVTDVQPNEFDVDLAGDAFSTEKKSLVRSGNVYDLLASANPCNVQVKLVRKTGLVTGSFSLWSENSSGAQKEITGQKMNGVLVLSRDAACPLAEETIVAGFWNKSVKVTDTNPDTGRTSTRNWNLSLPFDVIGEDQGEIDWYADDWGEAE